MSYSEVHIYFKLQSIVYWLEKNICDDFDRCVLQIRFSCEWLIMTARSDEHNENPDENIEQTYLCGQECFNHGTRKESE